MRMSLKNEISKFYLKLHNTKCQKNLEILFSEYKNFIRNSRGPFLYKAQRVVQRSKVTTMWCGLNYKWSTPTWICLNNECVMLRVLTCVTNQEINFLSKCHTRIKNPLHRQSEKACMCFLMRDVRTRDFMVSNQLLWKKFNVK